MPENNEMPELKFKAVDAEGRQIDCDTLFMFESPETGKNYIVYTDNSKDEMGNIEVYASIYHPEINNGRLEAIETEKEWKIIETILKTIQDEVKNSDSE